MFGGKKFNRNSELLRDNGDDKSNVGNSIVSVNDTLFQQINDAENYAKQILKTGQSQYVDGIKQNILDAVRSWLQEDGDNIFTLYGKMGCGKSFFSARLYQDISAESELYDTVAFSSQQLYRDTTLVRNMLLSLAHQLFNTIPACSAYFAKRHLNSESIADLTEDVLIKPFEGVSLQKKVFIIIDGLDEYPRQDCEIFLEALGKLRMRMNPRVKIFFASRPEAYIISEMFNDSPGSSYHIEKNEKQSNEDCARFIDAKCARAAIEIDEQMKRALIEKSECSLKYLECFFHDIACGVIQVTADFIENLPVGLSHYYRDQLVRYFDAEDQSLRFYQTKIVPLLEILCVAWRPITIEDASDILGCRESEINTIISRSGTLLWRNNRYVMLYQSESIREFLMDERYCPEKYRVDSQNGNNRILQRLEEIMSMGEDIENNLYLFHCAVDHILGKDRILNADWNLLVQVAANYIHKSDLIFKLAKGVLEKTPREIAIFLRCLHNNSQIEQMLKDQIAVRLIGTALQDKLTPKLQAVLDLVDGQEEFSFLVSYGRIRMLRSASDIQEALALLQPHLSLPNDDPVSLFRHVHYLDEVNRIYRRSKMVTWEETTRLHVQVALLGEQLLQLRPIRYTAIHLCLVNSLAVSYDQLARLCDKLEEVTDTALREACGQTLLTVLNLPGGDPKQPGFFLMASEAAFQKELKLSKLCQQYDPFSNNRIHQLHYAFYALGILYFRKDYPGYNPDKAQQYFEDCLSSIEEIAKRPESHIRFIDVAVKLYDRLYEIYIGEKQFALAKTYFAQVKQMRDLRYLYHPSADTDFSRCYSYEQNAELVLAEYGVDAAESYYLTAVQHYQSCCQKYPDRFVQRSLYVVYSRLAKRFKEADNLEKYIHYMRLELEALQRLYSLYPSQELRWDWGLSQERLANALRRLDPTGTVAQRIELQQSAIAIYQELAAAYPQVEKYFTGTFTVYYYLALDCRDAKMYSQMLSCLETICDLGQRIAAITREYDCLLELPVRLFLLTVDAMEDPNTQQKFLDLCNAYVDAVRPVCQTEDFENMRLYLVKHELTTRQAAQGFQTVEPLWLDYVQQGAAFAEKWPSVNSFYRLAYSCVVLSEDYQKGRDNDKAVRFLQEALKASDAGLQQWPNSKELRKLQAYTYGCLADLLKYSSDIEQISDILDLYILQSKSYILLFKESEEQKEKEKYGKWAANTCTALAAYLRTQEALLKHRLEASATSNEQLRSNVQSMVKGYSFLADMRISDAQEKLDYYTDLLARLENE